MSRTVARREEGRHVHHPYIRAAARLSALAYQNRHHLAKGFKEAKRMVHHHMGKRDPDNETAEFTDKYHPGTTVYRHKHVHRKGLSKRKLFHKALNEAAALLPAHSTSGSQTLSFQWRSGFQGWFGVDFLCGPYLKALINTEAPSGTAATERLTRIDVEHSRISFQLLNVVNESDFGSLSSITNLDIMILKPRRDFATTEFTDILGAGLNDTDAHQLLFNLAGYSDGTINIAASDAFADNRGTAIPNAANPHFMPFANSRFCKIFVIDSIRRITLQPGEAFTFEHVLKRPKWVTGERVASSAFGTNTLMHYIKGISEVILFRGCGLPSATFNAGFGGSGINIDYTVSSQFKYVDINQPTYSSIPV